MNEQTMEMNEQTVNIIQIKWKWNSVYSLQNALLLFCLFAFGFFSSQQFQKKFYHSFVLFFCIYPNLLTYISDDSPFWNFWTEKWKKKKIWFQPQTFSVPNNIILYCFSHVSQYIEQLGYPLNANTSAPFYAAVVIPNEHWSKNYANFPGENCPCQPYGYLLWNRQPIKKC